MSDVTEDEITLAIASARAGLAQVDDALQTLGDLMVGVLSLSKTPTAGTYTAPPLEQLVASTTQFSAGSAAGTTLATILNRLPGSTLTVVNDARFAISQNALLAGLTPVDPGTVTVTLEETNDGSSNSPRLTTLTFTAGATTTTVPNPFSFTAAADVAVSTVTLSNIITPTGFTAPSPISVTGGEYQINGGTWTSSPGTLAVGLPVRVRGTSSATNGITTSVTLTIGGVNGTFNITTVAASVQNPSAILTDPVLWGTAYDPNSMFSDDGVTKITEGGLVYRANDKSGHGYHARQTSATARPIYSATSYFGMPGLTFDGVGDFLKATGITLGTNKFSLFMSVLPYRDQSNDRYASFVSDQSQADYSSNSNVVLLSDNGSGPGLIAFNTYRNGASVSADQPDATPANVQVIYDGTNATMYINGSLVGSAPSAAAVGSTGDLYLGAGFGGIPGNFGKCVIQSWCVARGDITSGQRTAMNTWLDSPTGVPPIRRQTISGLKALQTTGSMGAGSTTLTVADASGFSVGDPIMVEAGGEVDRWHSVGGMWPYRSAPTLAALQALTTSDLTDAGLKTGDPASPGYGQPYYTNYYVWVSTNADGHQGETWQWNGAAWVKEPNVWWAQAKQNALLATITGKSGNTLTLDKPSVDATTNANVYFNNQPILSALSGPANTTFVFPDTGGVQKTYAVGGSSAPGNTSAGTLTYINKVGWKIDGLDKSLTRLKTPKGVPCVFFRMTNCTNCTITNIGMDGNMGAGSNDYGGFIYWKPGDAVINFQGYQPFMPPGSQFNGCNGCTFDTCEGVNMVQQTFGAAFSDACWALSCVCKQTVPFIAYTQWLILWSDCGSSGTHVTGGSKDCVIDCTWLTAGAEMFRSFGVTHENLTMRNGLCSINSGDYCVYKNLNVTIEANCQHSSRPDIVRNPIINVNSNVDTSSGSTTAGSHNQIIDAKIIQTGYVNASNDSLAFILGINGVHVTSTSTRRTTHVEDFKGYFECPDWSPVSQFRGADMRLDGDGATADNIRIKGTTSPGLATLGIDSGKTTAGSGSVTNCVLPDLGGNTPSISGGDVHTNNITNAAWLAGG